MENRQQTKSNENTSHRPGEQKKKLKTAVDEHVTITHADIAFYKAS